MITMEAATCDLQTRESCLLGHNLIVRRSARDGSAFQGWIWTGLSQVMDELTLSRLLRRSSL